MEWSQGGKEMGFWELFFKTLPGYGDAVINTIEITLVGLLIGLLIGLFFAFLKVSNIKILEIIADIYIYVIRGTPLIVQIFILYFGLVEFVDLGRLLSGGIALGVHNGAYIAEIFRGSIQSIDKGQSEAARSLGMNRSISMPRIVLLRRLRRDMQPFGNPYGLVVKE